MKQFIILIAATFVLHASAQKVTCTYSYVLKNGEWAPTYYEITQKEDEQVSVSTTYDYYNGGYRKYSFRIARSIHDATQDYDSTCSMFYADLSRQPYSSIPQLQYYVLSFDKVKNQKLRYAGYYDSASNSFDIIYDQFTTYDFSDNRLVSVTHNRYTSLGIFIPWFKDVYSSHNGKNYPGKITRSNYDSQTGRWTDEYYILTSEGKPSGLYGYSYKGIEYRLDSTNGAPKNLRFAVNNYTVDTVDGLTTWNGFYATFKNRSDTLNDSLFVVSDITTRRKADQLLYSSEYRYREATQEISKTVKQYEYVSFEPTPGVSEKLQTIYSTQEIKGPDYENRFTGMTQYRHVSYTSGCPGNPNLKDKVSVTAYPNPCASAANISSTTPFTKLELVNRHGAVTGTIETKAVNELEISTDYTEPGMLIVRAFHTDGSITRTKLFKN